MTLALCLICILLVPLAAGGLALIHQGLGRSRSAAHAMLATLCVLAVAAIVFVAIGARFAGSAGGPSYFLRAGGVSWDWIGAGQFFGRGYPLGSRGLLELCLQMFTVGLAAVIPVSAGTDRWRLAPTCLATAVLAGFVYPLFAHWAWGGGWLAQLGTTFGLPAFVDAGGAGVVQVAGGLMALSVAWIVGPRRGKYSDEGVATAIPGHNIVMVMFGCLLALVGWIALDSASSMLFYSMAPQQMVVVIINAMLSASAGCLAAVFTTQIRYRKPDASLSANGWIAGLVAGSASSGFVSPAEAIVIGFVAGVLVTYLVEVLELRLMVDDPGGAISVHAGAGLWGLIAAGIFGTFAPGLQAGTRGGHILAQLVGAATLLGCMLPLTHFINVALNRFVTYRVDGDGEMEGMDIRELGAGAYPEFMIHADDFLPR
jgi:Amt family ammonium transporter